MTQIDIKPINDLCNDLSSISREPVAPSFQIAEKWQIEPLSHLQIRKKAMLPLPPEMASKVPPAMNIWQTIYVSLALRGGTNAELLNLKVDIIRKSLLESSDSWSSQALKLLRLCEGVVFNITWVDAFTWQLPAADPAAAPAFLEIGRTMANIMWIESVGKSARLNLSPVETIERAQRIDACLCIAGEGYDAIKER